MDKMISSISKKYNKGVKHKINKLRIKIYNLIHEAHWKTANMLCNKYNIILIPVFNSSQMIKKMNRKINAETVRKMLSWSHYKFRERLINKSREYNCEVVVCNESYTSMTCSKCGEENKTLGSQRVFKCKNCKVKIGRDLNGARNILLRALVVSPGPC
jgi:putative transposase